MESRSSVSCVSIIRVSICCVLTLLYISKENYRLGLARQVYIYYLANLHTVQGLLQTAYREFSVPNLVPKQRARTTHRVFVKCQHLRNARPGSSRSQNLQHAVNSVISFNKHARECDK